MIVTTIEKMEALINHYDGCYDLSIARYKVAGLTDEDFDAFLDDDYFKARINSIDAGVQEGLILKLNDLTNSATESIKLRAVIEMGKIMYSKKFNNNVNRPKDDEVLRRPTIIMKGVYPEADNE